MTEHSHQSSPPLQPGKLPPALLAELLAQLPTDAPDLLLGPSVGEDAAVIDFSPESSHLLVAKSDPITFATDEIGYYAVNICANDLAVTGAAPRFYLPTLLLPAEGSDEETARRIFGQLGAACAKLDIVVAGGHSEVTHTVVAPVVAGTMLGQVARSRFVSTRGCRPGDAVLIAGGAAVEGASIIARERRDDLLARGWDAARLDEAAGFLYDPGISVLTPALAAAATGRVHAMHDPTEGGVATGLHELAAAAGVTLEIELDDIPILPAAADLCAAFDLDPLGTIASGALLAACAQEDVAALIDAWAAEGWEGRVIGRAVERAVDRNGEAVTVYALHDGRMDPLGTYTADEITKLWA